VKETVLNDGVATPEQRGVLSVGRDVWYTTVFRTQLYIKRNILFFSLDEATKRDR